MVTYDLRIIFMINSKLFTILWPKFLSNVCLSEKGGSEISTITVLMNIQKMKRQINSITDKQGNLITEPTSINQHFYNHFRNTYSADDPQQIELEEFLGNDINRLGKITNGEFKDSSKRI